MSTPANSEVKKLRRFGRYLVTVPRADVKYDWQTEQDRHHSFSDSYFAGCTGTAKSTSGAVVVPNKYYVTNWRTTQETVAQSGREAELIAAVKYNYETMGISELAEDW